EKVQNHMTKPRQLNLLVAKIETVHASPNIRKAPSDATHIVYINTTQNTGPMWSTLNVHKRYQFDKLEGKPGIFSCMQFSLL
ncbi:40036_t:CDS:2, partial [Gigaspora margarita]